MLKPHARSSFVRLSLPLASSLVLWSAFALSPASSPMLLAGEVDSKPATDKAPTVAELIKQLGSPEYLERRQAEKALERLGFEAFDALKEAESNPDVEIATAARYLASRIKVQWARDADPPEVRQLLQDYADQSEEARLQRAVQLNGLAKDAGLDALCRIIRFESSAQLSKKVAILLLSTPADQKQRWLDRAGVIETSLADSQRPAVAWLRSELIFNTKDAAEKETALTDWKEYTDAEQVLLKSNSDETNRSIVSTLLRHRSKLLRQLGRRDEAKALLVELIALEDGEIESLLQLVGWLSEDEAWDLVDQVAKRFGKQFESEPLLLYSLAQVKLQQKADAEAQELAAKAKELAGEDSREHLRVAIQLQERGMFPWAEQEYREVLRIEPITGRFRVFATYRLSEMLHDQQRDKDAGEVLTTLTSQFEKNPNIREIVEAFGLDANALRSRGAYFLACDQQQKKAFAEQRKLLDEAIGYDSTDADVLIAMHRFAEADEAYRQTTSILIKKAAEKFRQDIDGNPEDPQGYNQYAWLIGNTEGNYDEALKFSLRSLELAPDRAGYLDTLGRCYYALGDYENAIKNQARAVELDPHSLVIRRQLDFFKAEQAKTQKDGVPSPAPTNPEKKAESKPEK
jgi:tetratricopeptide (TPR) repeat protein